MGTTLNKRSTLRTLSHSPVLQSAANLGIIPDGSYSGGAWLGTNWLSAIQTAGNDLPDGATIYFSEGIYRMEGTLSWPGKRIRLLGAGGGGEIYSSAPFIRHYGTKFVSNTNAPLIHTYETIGVPYSDVLSQGSVIEGISLEGITTAGSSQKGIWIDNRGTHLIDVQVAGMGSHGILRSDCVAHDFERVGCYRNAGDGWRDDTTVGTDTINAAVTDNTDILCVSGQNTGNGYTQQGDIWGNTRIGGDLEGNTGYGWLLTKAGTGSAQPRFNRAIGVWVEGNTIGSVRIGDNSVQDNDLDFVRVDTTPTFVSSLAQYCNSLHYSDLSLTGRAQRKIWQYALLRQMGLNTSDIPAVTAREYDDSGDGRFRASQFVSTYGITMGPGTVLPSTVSTGNAFCVPNQRGLSSRNAAATSDFQLIVSGPNDSVQIAGNGNTIELYGPAKPALITAASAPNNSLFADTSNSNKLSYKDTGGTVHALY